MDNIFMQMTILFVIIVAGFISRKFKIQDHDFDRTLSRFILSVSLPCLILSSVMGQKLPDKELVLPLIAVGIVSYIVVLALACLVSRLYTRIKDDRGLYAFMLTYGNVGFIGYPVVASIFGNEAIFFASVLNFANSIFVFSTGPALVAGGFKNTSHKLTIRFFFSPVLLASYISIAIVFLGIENIPPYVSEPLTMLGNITVPGSLLIIGSSIAQMPLRQCFGNLGIYAMCASRLFVLPLIVYFISMLLSDSIIVVTINTVLFAMPVATIGIMFCLTENRDEMLVAKGTLISTILSMLTIPCVTLAVERLNQIFLT